MKSKSCGWRGAHSLGHRSYGSFGGSWLRGKPRMKGDDTRGVSSYMDHVANAASFEAFNRREEAEILLSAEALPENSSFLSFAAFAKDHPERFFKLVSHLRPEFQELCIEYYVLNKSQSFIGQAHGFIQTRTWQALRIIEQAIGAMILIGAEPRAQLLMTILTNAGLESTEHGSLTKLILLYAEHRNYTSGGQGYSFGCCWRISSKHDASGFSYSNGLKPELSRAPKASQDITFRRAVCRQLPADFFWVRRSVGRSPMVHARTLVRSSDGSAINGSPLTSKISIRQEGGANFRSRHFRWRTPIWVHLCPLHEFKVCAISHPHPRNLGHLRRL